MLRARHYRKILAALIAGLSITLVIPGCGHRSAVAVDDDVQPDVTTTFAVEPIFNSRIRILRGGSPAKPVVVLIHGMGDQGMNDWRFLIPELIKDYYVLALDLPGFGASERKNALYDVDNYADVVRWLVDTYSQGPLRVVGHSLGGAIALRYTAKYPQRVESLVVADVAGILYRTTTSEHILRFDPDFNDPASKLFQPIINGMNILLRTLTGGFGAAAVQNRLYEILHDENLRARYLPHGSGVIAALGLVLSNFSADLDRIAKPTLIIWSDNDSVAPLRTGRLLEYKIKGSTLKIIHDGGHAPMLSQPELFNHMVLTAFTARPARSQPLIPEPRQSSTPEPGYCLYQDEPVVLSGDYGEIVIDHCANATLRNISSTQILIRESRVTIDNATTAGETWGLIADESIIVVRNSLISAAAMGLLTLESTVTIEQSLVTSSGYGMVFSDSVVEINGTASKADQALLAIESKLHATGADLDGVEYGLAVTSPLTLMFSVSHVRSAQFDNYLHGPVTVIPDEPL